VPEAVESDAETDEGADVEFEGADTDESDEAEPDAVESGTETVAEAEAEPAEKTEAVESGAARLG
jgi:hypothetical protein